jgi:Transposase DDE domain
MQEKIITIYCVCADFLAAYGFQDDPQTQMTTAEVMTVVLVAATFFVGNQERSRLFLKEYGYMPKMLSKSRLNRRLHALPDTLWQALFSLLAEIVKQTNPEQIYLVDSLPVPVCDNIRIFRCHLYQDEAFRIRVASKKRYIYGLRVHLLISSSGQPVELVLAPASVGDITAFRSLPLDLPAGAEIHADAAYTDYLFEDTLAQVAEVHLIAHRKSNSTRPHPGFVAYLSDRARKRVETTFSQIAACFGRNIHAVTPRGFELKVFLTVLAYAIVG